MSISVAMAVCNGEKYIEQQLNSIIHNLKKEDEIIISYNASEDATLEMIEEAAHQHGKHGKLRCAVISYKTDHDIVHDKSR